MPNKNIFQQRIRPVLPRILQEERVFVYVPKASSSSAGIAYFPDEEFTTAADGKVTLKWPMSMQIENNKVNNPLQTMARVKVNEDEFVNTNEQTIITHPTTNKSYSNTQSAIKFKRTGQNLFNKPGFMMVDNEDFEQEEIDSSDIQDPGRYVKYKLKHNNPLEKPSLVKLNNQDFAYTDEALIRWPYAHDPASGTNRTNNYGLVKIQPNSEGFLTFDKGFLKLDISKLKESGELEPNIAPTYGGKNDGFDDYDSYVTPDGLAKRDVQDNILLKLTKDAIGLSKVQNKAFSDYIYTDFGSQMQNHFTKQFNLKLDVSEYDKLFSDWREPAGITVQKVVKELRAEDASIRDAMRTNRSFLGFYEDILDLEGTYPAGEWTFGSMAYIRSTSTYWRVRPNNVSQLVEGRAPVKSDIPVDIKTPLDYRIGRKDTKEVYQWDGSKFVLLNMELKWVDIVLANKEDVDRYINSHASDHFEKGFRIGCRETGEIYESTGPGETSYHDWLVEENAMYYEWANTYSSTIMWHSFVETDPTVLKPDGVANVGISGKWVSSDHVHPTDETRLAKDIFDSTKVELTSAFNNNSDTDFNIELVNGGDKLLNVPYVRVSKAIHNWNGQTTFIDSVESEEYYWSGSASEFEDQADMVQNKTLMVIEDDEQFIPQDLVQVQDLRDSGITVKNNAADRFVITKTTEVQRVTNTPLTVQEVVENGKSRYMIKNILPSTTKAGQLLITKLVDNKPSIEPYSSTNNIQATLLGFTAAGNLVQMPEEKYTTVTGILQSGKLVVGNIVGRNVKSLTSIDNVDGGIIVADGNGAIKSTSFTSAGKLLQTAGTNGEKLTAVIDVDTLVTSSPNEFEDMGIVVSNAVGGIERQDLGLIENKLLVTDGAHGLKVQTLDNESLVYVDNTGKIIAFPTTAADSGKVLTVQSNGKVGVQNLPTLPTHLPVTTVGASVSGTKLSFGQTSVFEEGVLYLW